MVVPQVFKSIEILEGDGGVGTVWLFTFGDDVPFISGEFKQDVINAINFTYNYTFFKGGNLMGILDFVNHLVKIVPSADGGCVFKQAVIYNCKVLKLSSLPHFPLKCFFKVLNNFYDIAPKVVPQVFKSIEILEGDGGVGTVWLFTFGDDIPFISGKFKQDVIDASNFTYNYTFFKGDNLMGILDFVNHLVKIVPSADGGCVFKQAVIYNCKGDKKPSAETLNFENKLYEKTYKTIEAYAVVHPEAY
ncbi:hypothetical protein SSX86_014644 [Deinandra increscens subsp. villosa]|uniref:Bet v I/Major latex protein domain-containing protein n=1 Tax=Deinandra increscens subsp. villosa TaxID=3103831 RepID=A0AAP0GXT7_9ASTR